MKVNEFDEIILNNEEIAFLTDGLESQCDVCIREVIAQGLRLQSVRVDDVESLQNHYPKENLDAIAKRLIDGAEGQLLKAENMDAVTFYAYLGRVFVELLRLYGFTKIDLVAKEGDFAPDLLNLLILCLGAGYGFYEAKYALGVVLSAYRVGVKKRLIAISLTKGGLYPFVQKTELFFERYITKNVFEKLLAGNSFKTGGLSFRLCAERVLEVLRYKK